MNSEEISTRAKEIFSHQDKKNFLELVSKEDAQVVLRIIGLLAANASLGNTGERLKGLRDACTAIFHEKLTDRTIKTMERLDSAANKLTIVGLVLAAFATTPILFRLFKCLSKFWN